MSSMSTGRGWSGRPATRRAACRTGRTAAIAPGSTNIGSRRLDFGCLDTARHGWRPPPGAAAVVSAFRLQPNGLQLVGRRLGGNMAKWTVLASAMLGLGLLAGPAPAADDWTQA